MLLPLLKGQPLSCLHDLAHICTLTFQPLQLADIDWKVQPGRDALVELILPARAARTDTGW